MSKLMMKIKDFMLKLSMNVCSFFAKVVENTETNDGDQGFHVEVAYSIVFFVKGFKKQK